MTGEKVLGDYFGFRRFQDQRFEGIASFEVLANSHIGRARLRPLEAENYRGGGRYGRPFPEEIFRMHFVAPRDDPLPSWPQIQSVCSNRENGGRFCI